MSAEYDIHAETESEDGGVPLAKVESDEMDVDAGSDTTPTSQESGESSSSSTNAWAEALPSSSAEPIETEDDMNVHQYSPASLNDSYYDSLPSLIPVPQHALDTASLPTSDAHNLEALLTTIDGGFGPGDQIHNPYSANGNSHEEWADQPSWSAINHALSNGIQPPDSPPPNIWSPSSDTPQASTAGNNILPDHSEPPADTSEETTQEAIQNVLEDHTILPGMDHTDGSDEDWLALSEDQYNIFNDISQMNGTLHTLNQASNMVSYYDQDDFEDSNYFSVSSFLYYWKQMSMIRKPDYPFISQLANERAKIKRPDKITARDCEQCDLQGIHWSRYQTTKDEAREVRRMTYKNLRNLGQAEQNFATKEFKARFPGAVLPSSDYYFRFKEMDMKRGPDFAHFQLRHNLCATSKNAIFYTNRPPRDDDVPVWDAWHKTIVAFNPETGTEECAMDVKRRFNKDDPKINKIHTLTAGNGVLVAGSFEGVYALKSLSASFESAPAIGTIATGGDVSTNQIHTYLDRQSGLPRAVFGSNDRTVRILDCVTGSWLACHRYPYQVNCSITSPDGRLRLINGDACEPIVANAETGETLAKLPGHTDYGFACDWAPDGITMATGHQDGLVNVWDARRLSKPIQTIAMDQAGCRSLQFSPLGSGKRVLVLAEPADLVHIVDAQTFESKQTVDFFGEISGISMPLDGSKLYIANADAKFGGLMEFERSWDSGKYNRRPFRVMDWEGEHHKMVDCIVDGVQLGQGLVRSEDELYHEWTLPVHKQGLPSPALPVIDGMMITCEQLFSRCFRMGGGRRVTARGEWPLVARMFGASEEEAASLGQELCGYWQEYVAMYEIPYVKLEGERALSALKRKGGGLDGLDGFWLDARTLLPFAEEGHYGRDYKDPRRKDFKIGRRSETLDWLSESDMEHDARVVFPKGQRGRQWMSRAGEDEDDDHDAERLM